MGGEAKGGWSGEERRRRMKEMKDGEMEARRRRGRREEGSAGEKGDTARGAAGRRLGKGDNGGRRMRPEGEGRRRSRG